MGIGIDSVLSRVIAQQLAGGSVTFDTSKIKPSKITYAEYGELKERVAFSKRLLGKGPDRASTAMCRFSEFGPNSETVSQFTKIFPGWKDTANKWKPLRVVMSYMPAALFPKIPSLNDYNEGRISRDEYLAQRTKCLEGRKMFEQNAGELKKLVSQGNNVPEGKILETMMTPPADPVGRTKFLYWVGTSIDKTLQNTDASGAETPASLQGMLQKIKTFAQQARMGGVVDLGPSVNYNSLRVLAYAYAQAANSSNSKQCVPADQGKFATFTNPNAAMYVQISEALKELAEAFNSPEKATIKQAASTAWNQCQAGFMSDTNKFVNARGILQQLREGLRSDFTCGGTDVYQDTTISAWVKRVPDLSLMICLKPDNAIDEDASTHFGGYRDPLGAALADALYKAKSCIDTDIELNFGGGRRRWNPDPGPGPKPPPQTGGGGVQLPGAE